MKVHICDICGKDLYSPPVLSYPAGVFSTKINPLKIKIKKYENTWADSISPWKKIEVCTDCANNIYKFCKKYANK